MNATTNSNNIKNSTNLLAAIERFRSNPRIIFVIIAAAAISIVIILFFWAKTPDYRALYSNLGDQDGGAVVAQLTQMNVPYRFDERRGAILVPEDQVYELRLKLAQQGLPKGGSVGFELLDQEKFGISQFSEQINFQRALEGELSRTIDTLGPVKSSRVHLALPKVSLFVQEQKPPSASVTLNLVGGRTLDAGQISAISHLVSSAVSGMSADNVNIVDQNGHLLTQSGAQATQTSQLGYISKVENDYQTRIQAILAPLVGSNNVRAQVTASIDFSTHEQTAEQYQPNSAVDKKAIRSRQSSGSEQGGKSAVGGVPGALSNQPPVPTSAPIDTPASAGDPNTATVSRVPYNSLSVVNSPFTRSDDDDVAVPLWKQPGVIDIALQAGRYLLLVLVAWLLWHKAVQPFWIKHQQLALQRLELEKQARQAELDAEIERKESIEKNKVKQRVDTEITTQHLRSIAEQEPHVLAAVIRKWMIREQKP